MARHEEISITEVTLVSNDGGTQFKLSVGDDGKMYVYKLVSGTWVQCGSFDTE